MAESKEGAEPNLDDDAARIYEKKLMSGKDHQASNHHHISLDENVFKLAQQNKKGHLELGIEDFLDGDIVSYLFNENRNLMEFNPEHGRVDLLHSYVTFLKRNKKKISI